MQQTRLRYTAAVALMASLACPAFGQEQIQTRPAPKDVLQAFDLTAGSVQELTVPTAVGQPFTIDVVLAGRQYTLRLDPVELRAHDFKVLLDDGTRLTQAPAGDLITYQGTIVGLQKARVAATLIGGRLSAEVFSTGGTFAIQSIKAELPKYRNTEYAVYAKRNVRDRGTRCDTVDPGVRVAPGPLTGNSGNALKEAEIAIDCDNAFYNRKGKSATATRNAVMTVINAMDVIYKRDLSVQYKVTAILIRTTKVYSGTSTGALLSEMRTRWNANHGNIRRDLAHMFTGVGSFSGVVGTAYVSQVCTSAAYAVSKAYHTSNTTNTGLVSHECGHNWGAGHCNSNTPCYIMCSGLGGCSRSLTKFGAYAISQMARYRDTRTCLTNVVTGTYAYYGAGCRGSNGRVPLLSVLGPPKIGVVFGLRVTGAATNRPVTYIFGASRTRWHAVRLPFHFGVFGASGCYLYASANIQVGGRTSSTGTSQYAFTVPNNSSIVGAVFYNQAMVRDSGANRAGIAFTRAGVGRVGSQ